MLASRYQISGLGVHLPCIACHSPQVIDAMSVSQARLGCCSKTISQPPNSHCSKWACAGRVRVPAVRECHLLCAVRRKRLGLGSFWLSL
jgi:hypothetical protein